MGSGFCQVEKGREILSRFKWEALNILHFPKHINMCVCVCGTLAWLMFKYAMTSMNS